ncbi:hypothetical protein [Vibrio lentus]|uniref:Uncharacterized protein n=1 Tax=Vibrio lentus TaxID=136468 RepID=A0A2N7ID78_9VIBR|nr:hypothetical protein [Vibrio lentus]PML54961.1 hypothetical protein BCT74_06405 [Vibrio lentus]
MNQFLSKTQILSVSRISSEGWWLENTEEHVVKGTALGETFTQNLYTPSQIGMIARYDREQDKWSEEVEDMSWKPYWDINGQRFVIGEPDGEFPDKVIQEPPPEYDENTCTVLYRVEDGWKVFEILIDHTYYNEFGDEFIVSDINFELPANHSWIKPPLTQSRGRELYSPKLINGEWVSLIDYRGRVAYVKDRNADGLSDYEIRELGDVPDTHTLAEPNIYETWSDNKGWQYDIARHFPFKVEEEKVWRIGQLTQVINRIDQYEKDQNYPSELRTSPLTIEQYNLLLLDRKLLSDYPNIEGFPFCERPTLSGLAT